ncbi:hypothetical protein MRX96_044214 [Rhipicephalus microplus]
MSVAENAQNILSIAAIAKSKHKDCSSKEARPKGAADCNRLRIPGAVQFLGIHSTPVRVVETPSSASPASAECEETDYAESSRPTTTRPRRAYTPPNAGLAQFFDNCTHAPTTGICPAGSRFHLPKQRRYAIPVCRSYRCC